MPTPTPERIRIEFGADAIADLRDRLARTRWPGDFGNDDWRYGANEAWMRETLDYWRDGFDFAALEAAVNRYEHYRVVLDDVPVHYLHVRGTGPDPMPLVLTHGWPWTFWDFQHVLDPLTDPGAHGGDPTDAFDLIVPALPGYPFSGPLTTTGINVRATAARWVELVQDVLGYGRFGVHGGDWGASVTAQMAHEYADRLVGAHLSLPVLLSVSYYSGLGPEMYGPDEQGWYDRMQRRMATANAHVAVHTADPQTLAYGLNDSPAGLAAWILERRRLWSDHDGDVFDAISRDDLLAGLSLYWFGGSIGTSMRYYWEQWKNPVRIMHERSPELEAPTGIAVFPNDLIFVPRAVAERHTNLHRWTVMPRGGHFAAAEEPDLLVDDLRAFFRPLR
ncbi:MAG: epoxide hydrolase [Actinobacteria bacterium]|nr:epoxide hydrolase [Actinomycetota bacterium]